jgi:protein ImuA
MRASAFMAEGSFAQRFPLPLAKALRIAASGPAVVNLVPRPSIPSPRLRGEGQGEGEGTANGTVPHPLPVSEESGLEHHSPLLPLAIPHLDSLLAGGLRRDALHEIRSSLSRDSGAATGFAAAVLARLAAVDWKPILWIVEGASADEAGALYGKGLERLGLDPRRLIVVHVRKPIDALWVAEEGLACRGLAAVLAEIRGSPRLLDLTATRRLALRARSGVMGLLLRQSDETEPSAATTRWRAEPLPATTLNGYAAGIGRPAWRLILERNRRGATGTIDVEWDHGRRSLAAIADAGIAASSAVAEPAHSVPVPALPVDRPPPPSGTGTVVALPLPISDGISLREAKRRIARAR